MLEISGEWEDKIFKTREFIQELQKVQHSYYEKLFRELTNDGMEVSLEEWLYDYVYNDDSLLMFEEYLVQHKKIK